MAANPNPRRAWALQILVVLALAALASWWSLHNTPQLPQPYGHAPDPGTREYAAGLQAQIDAAPIDAALIFGLVATLGLAVLGIVAVARRLVRRARRTNLCGMCGRRLGQPEDPLSADCGGDCWGCISEVEADMLKVDLETYRRDPAAFPQIPDADESPTAPPAPSSPPARSPSRHPGPGTG
jgi:hypothetical protein